jgi:hypothetical protein
MDERVLKIGTSEKCFIFAANARKKNKNDLALQAEEREKELLGLERLALIKEKAKLIVVGRCLSSHAALPYAGRIG